MECGYARVQRAASLWSEHSSGQSQLVGNTDQERFKLHLNIADNQRLCIASVCSARLASHPPAMKLAVQRDSEHHDWRTHCSNIKYLPSEARDLSQKHSSLSAARTASAWHLPPTPPLNPLSAQPSCLFNSIFPKTPADEMIRITRRNLSQLDTAPSAPPVTSAGTLLGDNKRPLFCSHWLLPELHVFPDANLQLGYVWDKTIAAARARLGLKFASLCSASEAARSSSAVSYAVCLLQGWCGVCQRSLCFGDLFSPLKCKDVLFQCGKSGKWMRIHRNTSNEAEFSHFQKLIQRGLINLANIFFKK